jgi:ankyrin repeat protein
MNTNIKNEEIFTLLKNNKFDEIYNLIKTKKIINFDFRDNNYNYFIQYIVNYNQHKILKLILNPENIGIINVRLDILDSDGRSILYNCIKYNYIEILNELINFNKLSIGISIIDIKDRLGLSALHYSVIFNNFETLQILIENNADPYLLSNDGSNIFITCLTYKRNIMLDYLIKRKFNLNFISQTGETLLQIAVNYQNNEIINKLLDTNININNVNSDYGLNILHQSIILDNYDLFKKLLNKKVDINLPDFYGNSPLHYILIDKRLNFLSLFFSKSDIKFNNSNINGEIPLHILLDIYEDINTNTQINDTINNIITKIILESDLNIQDNQGVTCLMKIINNNLQNKFRDLLVIKPLNFFIEDNNTNSIILTDELMDILTESFYNQIKINKNELLLDWEKWCSIEVFDKLKTIIEPKNGIIGNNSEEICKNKIKHIIKKEKRTIPKLSNIELNFDNGIFTNYCYYTGSPIDILFGLLLLNQDFKSKGLKVVLDYPLTVNKPLENYYKKIGINYQYKLDFSNIEIIWSYQKLFFPSYFDDEINNIIKDANYIIIPIGIEIAIGSHANILFWDIKNKTIERFEPNGSNYPIGLNYNPELLDDLLKNKFIQLDPDIQYISPFKFLPTIGFQILENLETNKCKKIGDPNGFCGVWCIWWVYQRMLNIDNTKLNIINIANQIIKFIKFDNQSFKNIIRNFSKKITTKRDIYLKKYNLDINDWIVSNYSEEILDKLEKDIFKSFKL